METLEERNAKEKERHRQNMARKRAVEKVMRDAHWKEFTALRTQEESLLAAYWMKQSELQRRQSASPTAFDESTHSEEKATSLSLVDSYVHAVELGNAIHFENSELKARLNQYERLESLLRRDVDNFEKDPMKQLAEGDDKFYYEPVDAAACHDFLQSNYPSFWDHHTRFIQDETLEVQPFFGWSTRRVVGNGHHFHFSKRIPSANSAELAEFIGDEAWRVFNTPELFEQLHSCRVILHILQRVDASTSVALQSLPAVDNSVRRRCLTLASKIVSVDVEGHRTVAILLLGISPWEGLAKRNTPTVQFVPSTNAYLLLHQRVDECGQEFVEMSFSLHGDYASDEEARFVLVESGSALVRFEQMVLPRNLVTAD